MTADRKLEIEKAADEFWRRCVTDEYGITNLFRDCEKLGYKLIRYPIGSDNVLGFSQIRDGDNIIFSNSSVRCAREIFTVAHETGHFLLHLNKQRVQIIDKDFESNTVEEKEANHFAAALLMPEDLIRKYLSFEMPKNVSEWTGYHIACMMIAFNVSFDAVMNRLMNLCVVSKKDRIRLENEKNQKTVTGLLRMADAQCRLNEISGCKKVPKEFASWVLENYEHGVIPKETLERTLQYFDLTPEDLGIDTNKRKNEEETDLDVLIGGIDD